MIDNRPSIGILTSGGDCSGMNDAIYRTLALAEIKGYKCRLYDRGYLGLIRGSYFEATSADEWIIRNKGKGGSVILSSRCNEMREEKYLKIAAETIKKHNLHMLIVIGGDGTFRGINDLSKHIKPFLSNDGKGNLIYPLLIGIPGTIDNNLPYTHYTLGYDSAAEENARMIANGERTNYPQNGRFALVEVMGDKSGRLAYESAIRSNADFIMARELQDSPKEAIDAAIARIKKLISIGQDYFTIIAAENFTDTTKKKASNAETIDIQAARQRICDEVTRSGVNLNGRAWINGHPQRGGDTTEIDSTFALKAVQQAFSALDARLSSGSTGEKTVYVVGAEPWGRNVFITDAESAFSSNAHSGGVYQIDMRKYPKQPSIVLPNSKLIMPKNPVLK